MMDSEKDGTSSAVECCPLATGDPGPVASAWPSGEHFDERMNWTLSDIKRMYPDLCKVPQSVTLIDDGNKWNRIVKTVPDRSAVPQPQEGH